MKSRRWQNKQLLDMPAVRDAFIREWSRPDRYKLYELAERFGVSRQLLWKWAKQLGIERRRVTDDLIRAYLERVMQGALLDDTLLEDEGLELLVRHYVTEHEGLLGGLRKVTLLVPEDMLDKLRMLQATIVKKHLQELEERDETDGSGESDGTGEGCAGDDGGSFADGAPRVGNDDGVDGEVREQEQSGVDE